MLFDGRGGNRGTILSWSPRKNQRRLRCVVKVNWIKLEVPLGTRGRENSRVRISASAIRPLEYFPYGLASPALRRLHRQCRLPVLFNSLFRYKPVLCFFLDSREKRSPCFPRLLRTSVLTSLPGRCHACIFFARCSRSFSMACMRARRGRL